MTPKPVTHSASSWTERVGREAVDFRQPLRGQIVDRRKQEELMAIGGLRDAAKSLSKLAASAAFERKPGLQLTSAVTKKLIDCNWAETPKLSWVEQMCGRIWKDASQPAPAEAIAAFRQIIAKHTGHTDAQTSNSDQFCTTDVDAQLLESWRRAAKDPDDAVP